VAEQSIGARFVGRADLLRSVHRALQEGTGGAAQLTSRLTAAGGFGKTRLAIEYMHRYGTHYPGGIFWVNAACSDIEGEFWRVLSALDPNLPDLKVMRSDQRDVHTELGRALCNIGQPALYVIDNILEAPAGSDPPPIAEFCPALGAVAVLATSRQDTREAHVKQIPVDTLDRDPAILLLTDNVPGAAALSWSDWGRIAECVGYLPIAIDLINRCLALSSITPSNLLQRVGQAPRPVHELDQLREALRGQVPRDAVRGITEAFSISFEKLDGFARHLALLLAQLAPAPIPEEFMEALIDQLKSAGVRAALRSRHFVTGGGGLSFGVMHRLMADFLRIVAHASLPPSFSLSVSPPAVSMAQGSSGAATATSGVVGLLGAILATAQGDYAEARRIEERVLEVTTRALGEEHPDTLIAMDNLAEALRVQGDHAGARSLQEIVVEAMARVLGEEHPETLGSMNNLAATLWMQGDQAGAMRLQERALDARTRLLGEEDPRTLTSMCNLAEILRAQGHLEAARRLQERAAEAMVRVLGEEHPDTLTATNNLAATLSAQGDFVGARRLQEHVLGVSKRVLGDDHPSTLGFINNLAATLNRQGDHARAQGLLEGVTSMANLAATLEAQSDREGAARLLRKCLSGQRRVLGEEHSTTLAVAKALSRLEAQPLTEPPKS
jgi:tetratricopeptide (TPR) repeat protein